VRRALLLVLLALLALQPACRRKPGPGLRVVATTTLIAGIVEAVGGNRVKVTTIAPAGFCPGHFDVPPSAVVAANEARLLLNHGWEEWFPELRSAVANPGLVEVTARTRGNWMVPPVHAVAVEEIADLLVQVDPAGSAAYEAGARRCLSRVDTAATQARRLLAGRPLPKVICSDKQAPFLAWLGFDIVAVYGRPEDFTARELSRLAQVAVDSGVGLFVDNLQSGPDAGRALAEAAGASHVTLSNFPLEGSYPRQLLANADALLKALGTAPRAPAPVPQPPPSR